MKHQSSIGRSSSLLSFSSFSKQQSIYDDCYSHHHHHQYRLLIFFWRAVRCPRALYSPPRSFSHTHRSYQQQTKSISYCSQRSETGLGAGRQATTANDVGLAGRRRKKKFSPSQTFRSDLIVQYRSTGQLATTNIRRRKSALFAVFLLASAPTASANGNLSVFQVSNKMVADPLSIALGSR